MQLRAPQADAHGLGDGVLLLHAVIQHQERQQGAADAVAAGAVHQDRAVARVAQDLEDAVERRIGQAVPGPTGTFTYSMPSEATRRGLVERPGLHRVAQVEHHPPPAA